MGVQMASEEFKGKCLKRLAGILRASAIYNPPGVSTSILFADDADVCIIGTQFSSDVIGRPYGKDEILLLRTDDETYIVIAQGEFLTGDRMLPKTITSDGERLTITIGSQEKICNITDLLQKPLQIQR
jgi:hypothetical protein